MIGENYPMQKFSLTASSKKIAQASPQGMLRNLKVVLEIDLNFYALALRLRMWFQKTISFPLGPSKNDVSQGVGGGWEKANDIIRVGGA